MNKMNKVILMSIQPKWLVKILNGEKTIEIKKTMPKCELPIDVYLYCTKGDVRLGDIWDEEHIEQFPPRYVLENGETPFPEWFDIINGRVVAKFTLTKVDQVVYIGSAYAIGNNWARMDTVAKKTCLDFKDLHTYLKGEDGYAWHIDNLVIFNKPKKLSEFSIFKREIFYCNMDYPPYTDWVEYRVRKAPQSWQYAYTEGE